ncbi:MAG: hypothetical protein ACRD98_11915, partial [Nitrososphaera sp.]
SRVLPAMSANSALLSRVTAAIMLRPAGGERARAKYTAPHRPFSDHPQALARLACRKHANERR